MQFRPRAVANDKGYVLDDQVGQLTAMDAATMQGVIRRLIFGRLLERRSDPTDRRRVLPRLTPNGTTLLAMCVSSGFTVSERTLEPLNSSERTSLLDMLRRIY